MLSQIGNFLTGRGRYDPYGGLQEGDQGPVQQLPWYSRFSPAMSPTGLAVRGIVSKRKTANPSFQGDNSKGGLVGTALRGIAGLF